MIISRAASKHRLAQSRDTRRRWAVHIAAIAALILTVCIAQHSTAQVTIHVNTTQQGVTNVRLCSLQEAIYSSEFKASIAVGSTNPDTFYTTGCVAGTGKGDTIVLPPGAVFTFDHFWDGDSHNIYGPTATPVIFVPMTIEGNGATLRWVDVGFSPRYSRLFAVGTVNDPGFASGTGDLALRNVYVKGFHIKGGNGSDGGGGGGLGAGGAIFVDGFLTVENSTFERNGAVGGNGSGGGSLSGGGGGGGGGLSGNGGAICNAGGGGGARGNGGRGACGWEHIHILVAVGERFFPVEMEASVRAAPEGFAVAGMAGIMGMTATSRPVRAPAVVVVVLILASSATTGMAPRVALAVEAAAELVMVGTAASAEAVPPARSRFSPCMVGTADSAEAAAPLAPVAALCVRPIPAQGAPSAAVPTVRTGAAAGHWAGPYSAPLVALRCATVPSTTIT